MADKTSIEIQGDVQLIQKFDAGNFLSRFLIVKATQQSTSALAKEASHYPPTSEANSPPPPYYIRGTGTQYAKANRRESEQLGRHWTTDVHVLGDEVEGIVDNPTTYAPWVHGVNKQAGFHATRGWRNMEQIIEQTKLKILGFFEVSSKSLADFINR